MSIVEVFCITKHVSSLYYGACLLNNGEWGGKKEENLELNVLKINV